MEEGGRGARGGATWNTKWPALYRVRCDTLQRGEKDISVRTPRVDHVSVYRAPTIALTRGSHELRLSLSFLARTSFFSPLPGLRRRPSIFQEVSQQRKETQKRSVQVLHRLLICPPCSPAPPISRWTNRPAAQLVDFKNKEHQLLLSYLSIPKG